MTKETNHRKQTGQNVTKGRTPADSAFFCLAEGNAEKTKRREKKTNQAHFEKQWRKTVKNYGGSLLTNGKKRRGYAKNPCKRNGLTMLKIKGGDPLKTCDRKGPGTNTQLVGREAQYDVAGMLPTFQ